MTDMLKGHKSTVYCVDYANDGKDVGTEQLTPEKSAVQRVPYFLRALLARMVHEKPFQRFYWPETAID